MDDDSLEDQINQTRDNLPMRLSEIYGDWSHGWTTGPSLRMATVENTTEDKSKEARDRSEANDRQRKQSRSNHTLANQARKVGKSLKDAALSANDPARENLNSASQELNTEAADIAFAGTAGFIRGLKAGYASHKSQKGKDGEIVSADPAAIEAFLASLPPPPKAIAPPLKQLPAPGRYSGAERD
ncbi:hypothetical protein [Microvirga sp. VF16]|uniref:hypothetical protein n=1 Tax=Microvirga sp. VF16 TaxID=2807101 RepID=UPI00193EB5FB|nr:hypothetical protein [Microvirga sp. VF16]QRM34995.1 hypothetical protein JO965_42810 [Microvirga sp. VF16]